MSFVGGGSDLPSFYTRHAGAVVSTTVDKYIYVTVNPKFDEAIRVSYSKTEEVDTVDEIEHNIVREALKMLNIRGGIEITSVADIPAKGTGLGSSSAFTVGLLHALHAYNRNASSADRLAREASQLELEVLKEPIGKQDQYASAFGGLSFIRFNSDGTVFVDPIICRRETVERLDQNLIVFFTGIHRSASKILKAQDEIIATDLAKQDTLKKMVQFAYDLKSELENNQLHSVGEILHENWVLKKSMTDQVSTDQIDEWYNRARSAGAVGGKLLGAGGGGFLMFYAPQENHESIKKALSELRSVPFRFEPQGSKIIFVH